MNREISNDNMIQMYLHCGRCLDDLKSLSDKQSPSEYQQIEVGWTELGLQVWCKRHDCNIIHIDFDGRVHQANLTRQL